MFREPITQMGVLKLGMLDVGSEAFTSQREAWNWEFHADSVVLCQGWGLWPFLPVSMWVIRVFSHWPDV